ncbi:MAG TPA: hypothetical protein VN903_35295 [Polyangia bacterium]|jgi:hypothetical protein|nr:hypothetical protein [Polyangia bacterium]
MRARASRPHAKRGIAAALLLFLSLAASGQAAAADAEVASPPPIWIVDAHGGRFRVRFDPGERLILGAGAETVAGDLAGLRAAPAFGVELGLMMRSERPAPGWDVHWKRNHELAHLRLHPTAGAGGAAVDGVLYRGMFLRQSREGTLTLPVSPPFALPLPFDVGVLAEVGHLHGALWPEAGGAPVDAGIVHGEVLADFWRARQPGRWLTVGIGGRYEIGLQRDAAGELARDHRVSPMSTLAVALHSERADGLAAGGVRAEASHRWSSVRGWERAYRVDADAEVTPLAVNDRPVALFAIASAVSAPDLPRPEIRVMAGLRFSQPLR